MYFTILFIEHIITNERKDFIKTSLILCEAANFLEGFIGLKKNYWQK